MSLDHNTPFETSAQPEEGWECSRRRRRRKRRRRVGGRGGGGLEATVFNSKRKPCQRRVGTKVTVRLPTNALEILLRLAWAPDGLF